MKSFNLVACFITKCDAKCYDYADQNGGPSTAVYNNVRALVMFSCHTMSVLIGKKSVICDRAVKLNGQSEMFALISIPSQMFSRQCITKSSMTESDYTIIHLLLFFTTYHYYLHVYHQTKNDLFHYIVNLKDFTS